MGSEYISPTLDAPATEPMYSDPNLRRVVRRIWNLRQNVILLPYVELIQSKSLRILDVLNEITAIGNKRCV